ncbi:MAG: preprotein translocase subunit YajC [Gemmatimonadetes bacterium]|nr:preprotein translocase subunit YajC [Gemmatimonadota bacterium]MBK9692540.1 preprotein translocase subunit YajC [Gemmatimonadota bacterium]
MTLSLLALMAPAPDGSSAGLTMLLLQIGAIGLVFFFLILRPQQQARKKHEDLLKNLKKGDEVVTVGGLMGRVKDIKEDRVTIESGTAAVVVDRARIVKVGDQAAQGVAG